VIFVIAARTRDRNAALFEDRSQRTSSRNDNSYLIGSRISVALFDGTSISSASRSALRPLCARRGLTVTGRSDNGAPFVHLKC
jgi:hypothetical protein